MIKQARSKRNLVQETTSLKVLQRQHLLLKPDSLPPYPSRNQSQCHKLFSITRRQCRRLFQLRHPCLETTTNHLRSTQQLYSLLLRSSQRQLLRLSSMKLLNNNLSKCNSLCLAHLDKCNSSREVNRSINNNLSRWHKALAPKSSLMNSLLEISKFLQML